MSQAKGAVKITFYAEPDIKKWLDKLDPGIKSHSINKILRTGIKRGGVSAAGRLEALEARTAKLELDTQFDGMAIGALRRFLLRQSGGRAANELGFDYMEVVAENNGMPPRVRWQPDRY